ncbi:hypothetical protein AVEN_159069-1 [Araneus ventricosus]|uniref:Uncharacterized protein n=1 Tax=Araneus ventricosus TaxID=182803 RepID=A0A4Y2B9N2_ARAVE|nr:hypothetical protein AVEN_159069-1 [Araneus ventricosus]
MTGTTPELASPSPNFRTPPAGGRLTLYKWTAGRGSLVISSRYRSRRAPVWKPDSTEDLPDMGPDAL